MKWRQSSNIVRLNRWRRKRGWKRKAKGAPQFADKILKAETRKRDLKTGAVVMFGTFVIGLIAVLLLPQVFPENVGDEAVQSILTVADFHEANDPSQPQMALCGSGVRQTCVVDGDTIWLRGEKIRVADIDTPEVGQPKCDYEYQLGMRATYRLRDLLNEGPFSVERIGSRDEDGYGRKLRVLTRNGRSIGDMLVSEGLARTWSGRREPWC